MSDISAFSRLAFFRVSVQEHGETVFDASCEPRPRFCMGLLLSGKASFRDCTGSGESFMLYPGELVFVPITTRYVSHWMGDPTVKYISLHFDFEYPGIFTRHRNFKLQKYTPEDPKALEKAFRRISEDCEATEELQLGALSEFFGILSTILPKLETGRARQIDGRVSGAVAYIEKNYAQDISVDKLASICNMSSSRFFPAFKAALGVTPVDYLNHFRINRAMAMLINDDSMSIESISCAVGFDSSTYFRRVFKRITGRCPKEYRRMASEI